MKNILKLGVLLSCCIWLLCSCEKEDDTFTGKDHFISSFVLEKEGAKYIGAITDGMIELTVPANVDLAGARVEYVLCEQATIVPDPATVTEWGKSQQFTVTSYNNTTKDYIYTVKYTELSSSGEVKLVTQADVDAFARLGISVLDGNLIVGEAAVPEMEFDTIKTLTGLNTLRKVTGNIVVNNSYGGKDLKGLEHVQYAGNIYIGNEGAASATIDSLEVAFGGLTTVAGEMVIHSAKVRSISFPKVTEALYLFLNVKNAGTISMPELVNVYGDFIVQSGTSTSVSTANSRIETLSFPGLQNIGGSLTVQSFIKMTSLGFPKLSRVAANVSLLNLSEMESMEISALTEAGGLIKTSNLSKLKIFDLSKLKRVGSIQFVGSSNNRSVDELRLSALETVNGQFQISYQNITSLSLEKLKTVKGRFYVQGFNNLAVLNTPVIEECASVYFYDMPLIEQVDFSKIDSLPAADFITSPKLAVVKSPAKIGKLSVNAGSKVAGVPAFEGLQQVDNVTLDNFYNTEMVLGGFANSIKKRFFINGRKLVKLDLQDMESAGEIVVSGGKLAVLTFPNLKQAGILDIYSDELTTLDVSRLESIDELILSGSGMTTLEVPHLKKAGTLDITMYSLTAFDLPELTEISRIFRLGDNYGYEEMAVSHLDGLSGITSIGKVEIKNCRNLANYAGLKNALSSLSSATWSVTKCKYNPTYEDMVAGKYTQVAP